MNKQDYFVHPYFFLPWLHLCLGKNEVLFCRAVPLIDVDFVARPKFGYDSSPIIAVVVGEVLLLLFFYFLNVFGPSVFMAFNHNIVLFVCLFIA